MKIVGKMQDSKKRTRDKAAMPALPTVPMAIEIKTMMNDMKAIRIQRGLTTFMLAPATKRPMAKRPCAIAS